MKKGFTIIEVLITTILLGLFIIFCFPFINKISGYLNNANTIQLNHISKINIYNKINQINLNDNNIYIKKGDDFIIHIGNETISVKENYLLINDVNYDIKVNRIDIKEKLILIYLNIFNEEELIILKGEIYEIY